MAPFEKTVLWRAIYSLWRQTRVKQTMDVLQQFALLEKIVHQEAKKVEEAKKLTRRDEEALRERMCKASSLNIFLEFQQLEDAKQRVSSVTDNANYKEMHNQEIQASVNSYKNALKEVKSVWNTYFTTHIYL